MTDEEKAFVNELRNDLAAARAERDENEGVIRVWRRRCVEAEAERDALRDEVARLRREAAEARALLQAVTAFQNGEPSRPPVSGVEKRELDAPHD